MIRITGTKRQLAMNCVALRASETNVKPNTLGEKSAFMRSFAATGSQAPPGLNSTSCRRSTVSHAF